MSEKREIDPGEGYVLTTKYDPFVQLHTTGAWIYTTCNSQKELDDAISEGCVYRRKMTSEELKAQAAKKNPSLGTAHDGSPMDLDWFINSLTPLCRIDKNSSGIGNVMALQSFVNNLMFKKKDQQL